MVKYPYILAISLNCMVAFFFFLNTKTLNPVNDKSNNVMTNLALLLLFLLSIT